MERGCNKPAPFKYWTDIDGDPQDRCPRLPILHEPGWYNRLITAYNMFKNGFLPVQGGINDQPALFPHVMSLIDNVVELCAERKTKKKPKPT